MNKNKYTIDPLAELKKDKNFTFYSKDARIQVRLAVEVYNKRKEKDWSQIRLAKEVGTTQRVISNIENGDVNIGIGLLKRLVDGLNLSNDDLGSIFESCHLISLQNNTTNQELVYTAKYSQHPQYQLLKYSTANI